jgi:cell division protein FtsL
MKDREISIALAITLIIFSFTYALNIYTMQKEIAQLKYETSIQLKQKEDGLSMMGQDLMKYRALAEGK